MNNQSLLQAATQAAKLLQEAIGNTTMSPNTYVPFAESGNHVLATPMSTIEREMNVTSTPPNKILVDRAQYERMQTFVQRTYATIPITPNTLSGSIDFIQDMYDICARYARGETL